LRALEAVGLDLVASGRPVLEEAGELLVEPRLQLGPEGLVLGGEGEVHPVIYNTYVT
jgi:hypothetical protein